MANRDWHGQIEVNLNGTANVLRVFAPTQGEHGTMFGASYSAFKWRLIG